MAKKGTIRKVVATVEGWVGMGPELPDEEERQRRDGQEESIKEDEEETKLREEILRQLATAWSRRYRVGFAVGGCALEPLALAGDPGIKRLQPLLPVTLNRYG